MNELKNKLESLMIQNQALTEQLSESINNALSSRANIILLKSQLQKSMEENKYLKDSKEADESL